MYLNSVSKLQAHFLNFFTWKKIFFFFNDVLKIIRLPESIVHKKSEWRKVKRNSTTAEAIVIKFKERPINFSAFALVERKKQPSTTLVLGYNLYSGGKELSDFRD